MVAINDVPFRLITELLNTRNVSVINRLLTQCTYFYGFALVLRNLTCMDRRKRDLAECVYSYTSQLRPKRPNRLTQRHRFRRLFGRYEVRISTETPVILTEVYRGQSQSLRANAGIVPRLGHDCFLPLHRTSVIQPFGAI
jgi:hypothetical protein